MKYESCLLAVSRRCPAGNLRQRLLGKHSRLNSQQTILIRMAAAVVTVCFSLLFCSCGSGSGLNFAGPTTFFPAVQIVTTSLPNGVVAQAYNATLQAVGGSTFANHGATFAWSIDSGSLPTGLSLTTVNNTGQISGTPQTVGTSTFTVLVTDTNPNAGGCDCTATQQLSITIQSGNNPVPTITLLSPSSATPGSPAFTLTITGSNFVGNPGGSTVSFGRM